MMEQEMMEQMKLTAEDLFQYRRRLLAEERSGATIQKYLRDAGAFIQWLGGRPVSKEEAIAYKKYLTGRYAAASVNSVLAGVNGFLHFLGLDECRVKNVKCQRHIFCAQDKELTKPEYLRLLAAARRKGNFRLYLVMEAICSTGIRISELRFLTVEAVRRGWAEVDCKGKARVVLLPKELCRKLEKYIRYERRAGGAVFVTRSGRPLDRSNVWSDMKRLCADAGVAPSKVFPHNLRHLFARTFYALEKDLNRLADLLGHSSIETTRIYTITTGAECARKIEALGLIV